MKEMLVGVFEILNLKININLYTPINESVSTFVLVPKISSKTKTVLNIHNNDEYCFMFSIIAALYTWEAHKYVLSVSSYKHFSQVLKYDSISLIFKRYSLI